MTGLDALRKRGWRVKSFTAVDGILTDHAKTIIQKGQHFVEIAGVGDRAERMAVAAALVAEGHDLIGLLREARDATRVSIPPRGWHDAQADIIARIDAVLAAVDGAA